MTVEIRIALDEASQARADAILSDLAERAANVEGALRNVGEALLETTDERFDTQTDPSGGKWAPLSGLTLRQRAELGHGPGPILTRSRRLRGSVSYQVSGSTLRLGPNTVDAAVHQFGATITPKSASALRIPLGSQGAVFARSVTIPARPYIGFGPRDEEAARDALEDWLDVEGDGG